jgi:RNA polymerase sigma-70 factor (ECF subfamily)
MTDSKLLATRFEEHRGRLRAIAYRMLGSHSQADDAVQEAWLRLESADSRGIANLGGWLTTVVARVCLHMLRARRSRPEDAFGLEMPDPVVTGESPADPEQEAVLTDSVGLALLVVLDTLAPAERLAFVLHDLFAVPFADIAPMIDRTPEAARQLASRARRRIRGQAPASDADLSRQREIVDAFFAASRDGEFERLLEILHPDVVLRADGGEQRPSASMIIRGASAVARSTRTYARMFPFVRPALVNGAAGAVVMPRGGAFAIMAFSVVDGKITAIDVLADPEQLRHLALPDFG